MFCRKVQKLSNYPFFSAFYYNSVSVLLLLWYANTYHFQTAFDHKDDPIYDGIQRRTKATDRSDLLVGGCFDLIYHSCDWKLLKGGWNGLENSAVYIIWHRSPSWRMADFPSSANRAPCKIQYGLVESILNPCSCTLLQSYRSAVVKLWMQKWLA